MKINFLSRDLGALLCIVILMLLSSCGDDMGQGNNQHDNPYAITCNVVAPVQRSMIENDSMLQVACTDGHKAIGLWSAYELDGVLVKNVLGNDHNDVSLIYNEATEWDNYQGWSYGPDAAMWLMGAKYTFNAYYPMHAVSVVSSSSISTFVVEYNTELYQEDLMMAYSYVDTNLPTFKLGVPVTLNMLHTLSALRFRFSFMDSDDATYEDSDALTAFWLENIVSGRGLATTGMLAFGAEDTDGTMNGERMQWYYQDYPEPSTSAQTRKIFPWEDAQGVAFWSTDTQRNMAVAYTTNSDGAQKYAGCNGYVMVIPQEIDDSVVMCFSLKSTGNLVHRVALPKKKFEPGMRYTYDIRFGRTNVDVALSIADWNELKSTQDIPL